MSYMNSSFIREIFDLCSIGSDDVHGVCELRGRGQRPRRVGEQKRSRVGPFAICGKRRERRCFPSPPRHHFRIAAL